MGGTGFRRRADQEALSPTELSRPLSALEKDVAFDCVAAMLTAKTLDSSISGVLKNHWELLPRGPGVYLKPCERQQDAAHDL